MKQIHLRKKRKWSKKNIFIIALFFIIVAVTFFVNLLGNTINPILLKYAQIETERFASQMVTSAITNELSDILKEVALFDIVQNEAGEIQTVDFNSGAVNQILKVSIDTVNENIKLVEEGKLEMLELSSSFDNISVKDNKVICSIPMGVVTNNSLLMNIGPYIPIRLGFVGSVSGNVETSIKEYGINNALIEVSIKIEVTEQITMPLVTKEVPLSIDIPVAMKMVQGKIPHYYQNGITSNSKMFSIPSE